MNLAEADRQALRDLASKCGSCGARLVDEQEQTDERCYDCTLDAHGEE